MISVAAVIVIFILACLAESMWEMHLNSKLKLAEEARKLAEIEAQARKERA
jgi:hypothetical protein